jgi:hypothetical protein
LEPTKQQAFWPYIGQLREGILSNVASIKPKALRILLTEAIHALDHIEKQIKAQADSNEASK